MSEYRAFIASRDRNWWRGYYRDAVKWAEFHLHRPLTLSERKLLVRAMHNKRDWNWLGGSSVLGMNVSMAIEKPDPWMEILFVKQSKEKLT